MKRMKKVFLVAVLLAAFVLQAAGCTQQPAASGAASASEGTSSAAASSAEKDYSKHEKISWAVYGDEFADLNSDDFAKMWNEKFNVEYDVISMSYDTWDEKIRIWTNSQDLPDVAQWEYKHADGASYAEQGLVKKLPDDWKTRWPNLAEAYEGTVVGPLLEEQFGGTYFLPRPVFANNQPTEPLVTHQSIFMRKDWLEAVGAEVKQAYTIDEFMDIARRIKEEDPGNMGDQLVPIGNGINELPYIFIYSLSTHSVGANAFYKDENGVYQWGPASQDTLTGLKYYQQAYEEGLLDPEFFTGETNYQEVFYTAGASAFCQAAGMAQVALRFANNFKTNLDLEAEDCMSLACVVDNDGNYHGVEQTNYWGTLMFSPNIDDAKLERVLDILDYSCTEQGQNEIRMGIENVDWKRDASGEIEILLDEGITVFDKYYCIRPFYHTMYICSDDFGLVNPTYPQMFRDMSYNQYQEKYSRADEKTFDRIDWDAYFYDSDAMRRVSFNLPEEYAALVVAGGDMETKWNAWVEEKMKLVQPVLDELNAM